MFVQTKKINVGPTSELEFLPVSLKALLLTRSATKIGKFIRGYFFKKENSERKISILCKDKDVIIRKSIRLANVSRTVLG